MKDSDPAVPQGTQGLVVGVLTCTALVVEGARPCTGIEGAEGPLIDRVVKPFVAGMTCQYCVFLSRRDGQG